MAGDMSWVPRRCGTCDGLTLPNASVSSRPWTATLKPALAMSASSLVVEMNGGYASPILIQLIG